MERITNKDIHYYTFKVKSKKDFEYFLGIRFRKSFIDF